MRRINKLEKSVRMSRQEDPFENTTLTESNEGNVALIPH